MKTGLGLMTTPHFTTSKDSIESTAISGLRDYPTGTMMKYSRFYKGNNMTKRKGKIIYIPPERCYTNVNIEKTDHGYAVYRIGESKPFSFIPTSAVKQIEYKE